jgi:acetyl esterase/lipase
VGALYNQHGRTNSFYGVPLDFIGKIYDIFYRRFAMALIMPTFPVFGKITTVETARSMRHYNLGGQRDSALYLGASLLTLADTRDQVVLVGHSRGCSTVFNALTATGDLDNLESYLSRIRAVILLNPFSSAQDAIRHHYFVPRFMATPIIWFYQHVASYNPAWDPINRIDLLPKELCYFVSYAKDDSIVPASSTRRLIRAMRAAGHSVEVLELNTNQHHFIYAPPGERLKLANFIRGAINSDFQRGR